MCHPHATSTRIVATPRGPGTVTMSRVATAVIDGAAGAEMSAPCDGSGQRHGRGLVGREVTDTARSARGLSVDTRCRLSVVDEPPRVLCPVSRPSCGYETGRVGGTTMKRTVGTTDQVVRDILTLANVALVIAGFAGFPSGGHSVIVDATLVVATAPGY